MSDIQIPQKYDPTWLLELVQKQFPDTPWLHTGVSQITTATFEESEGTVVTFIDRMEGVFFCNVRVYSAEHGRIILDILTDGRVAGLEILGSPLHEGEALLRIEPPTPPDIARSA